MNTNTNTYYYIEWLDQTQNDYTTARDISRDTDNYIITLKSKNEKNDPIDVGYHNNYYLIPIIFKSIKEAQDYILKRIDSDDTIKHHQYCDSMLSSIRPQATFDIIRDNNENSRFIINEIDDKLVTDELKLFNIGSEYIKTEPLSKRRF